MRDGILLFFVSLAASAVGAVSGIGGGVIIRPVLEAASTYSVETVSFLSGCTVLSMSATSVMREVLKKARFELRRGTILAVGAAFGGVCGKLLFDAVGSEILGIVQSLLLCLMMVGLLVYLHIKDRLQSRNICGICMCLFLGSTMGMLSSFLGIGGGPVHLVVLSHFCGMDAKKAAYHALYIIFVSQSANLLLSLFRRTIPNVPLSLLALVIWAGIGGGLIGSKLRGRMNMRGVEWLYHKVFVLVFLISAYNLCGYV